MPSRGFASVATIALTVVGLGCRGRAPAAPPAPPVTVAAVAERDVTDWDEFTGRLEAVDAVEVRPRAAGYITRVAFVEGSEVRQGAVLFEIDRRPYEAQLAGAEAELERVAADVVAAAPDAVREGEVFGVELVGLAFRHLLQHRFVSVDQAEVLHGVLRCGLGLVVVNSRSEGLRIDTTAPRSARHRGWSS